MKKKPKPEEVKLCLICGDVASACNFGALTCQPCKAFFRRNAHKDGLLEVCQNDCPLTKDLRGHCKSCRLKKCLRVGMNKNLIWTSEERQRRKQKIEDNKKKKGDQNQLDVEDVATEEPSEEDNVLPTEVLTPETYSFQGAFIQTLKPPPTKSDPNTRNSLAKVASFSSTETEATASSSNATPLSSESSTGCLNLDSFSDGSHNENHTNLDMIKTFADKISTDIRQMLYNEKEESSVFTSSLSFDNPSPGEGDYISNYSSFTDDKMSHELQTNKSNSIVMEEKACQEQVNATANSSTLDYDVRDEIQPSSKCLHESSVEEGTSNSPKSNINVIDTSIPKAQHIEPCDTETKPCVNPDEEGSKLSVANEYALTIGSMQVPRLDSSECASSSRTDCSNYQPLTIPSHVLNDMNPQLAIVADEVLRAFIQSYDKPIVEYVKQMPTLPEIFNQLEGYIRKSVTFSKYVPTFRNLPPSDQLSLIKESFLEMTNTYMMTTFNPKDIAFIIRHRLPSDPQKIVTTQSCMIEMTSTELGTELVKQFTSVFSKFNEIIKQDPIIPIFIMAYLLFICREDYTYIEPLSISKYNKQLLEVLENYIKVCYKDQRVKYSEVLDVIHMIRFSGQTAKQVLSRAPTHLLSSFVAPFTND